MTPSLIFTGDRSDGEVPDVQPEAANRGRRRAQAPVPGGEHAPRGRTDACGADGKRLQAYHDPSDEPTAEPLDPSFFDFDNGDPLGKEQLKGAWDIYGGPGAKGPPRRKANRVGRTVLIYEEVTKPRPPVAQ